MRMRLGRPALGDGRLELLRAAYDLRHVAGVIDLALLVPAHIENAREVFRRRLDGRGIGAEPRFERLKPRIELGDQLVFRVRRRRRGGFRHGVLSPAGPAATSRAGETAWVSRASTRSGRGCPDCSSRSPRSPY